MSKISPDFAFANNCIFFFQLSYPGTHAPSLLHNHTYKNNYRHHCYFTLVPSMNTYDLPQTSSLFSLLLNKFRPVSVNGFIFYIKLFYLIFGALIV